jgi:hypothetical protein
MTVVETLQGLGFDASDLGTKNGKTLVKVKTAKGWAYERLATEDDARQWAADKTP